MANLFFIHTPLQLLIAQQIIRQEKLKDNVMLYGYVDDNKHFLDIYDLTIIEEFWNAKVPMPQVARWAVISRKHLWRDCKRAYSNYQFIKEVIRKQHIDTLFLGDMKNLSCQLAAMSFHKKGLRICFFEEGSGHYVMDYGYGIGGNVVDKIYATFIDIAYYRPLYRVPFGYIRYWKGFTLSDLPIDVRYSIVPFYHESFDRLVTCQPMLSERLLEFMKEETLHLDTNHTTLLLTSPFYNNGIDDNPEPYVKTIVDYAKALNDTTLHIKFHPRETNEVCEMIMKQLNDEGITFLLLGTRYNIPVEYYLQYVHYERIVMFLCSTSYYNGYLFPKTVFESIMESYYEHCEQEGSANAKMIKNLLDQMQ